jgi:hypothetical protein
VSSNFAQTKLAWGKSLSKLLHDCGGLGGNGRFALPAIPKNGAFGSYQIEDFDNIPCSFHFRPRLRTILTGNGRYAMVKVYYDQMRLLLVSIRIKYPNLVPNLTFLVILFSWWTSFIVNRSTGTKGAKSRWHFRHRCEMSVSLSISGCQAQKLKNILFRFVSVSRVSRLVVQSSRKPGMAPIDFEFWHLPIDRLSLRVSENKATLFRRSYLTIAFMMSSGEAWWFRSDSGGFGLILRHILASVCDMLPCLESDSQSGFSPGSPGLFRF